MILIDCIEMLIWDMILFSIGVSINSIFQVSFILLGWLAGDFFIDSQVGGRVVMICVIVQYVKIGLWNILFVQKQWLK